MLRLKPFRLPVRGWPPAALIAVVCLGGAHHVFGQTVTAPSREYIYAGDQRLAIVSQRVVSIADSAVLEGQSGPTSARFSLTLSEPSAQAITVSYATADGTALAGSDYVAATGTITFPPNTTTQEVGVTVLGDGLRESPPRETFFVNLSNPSGAVIADGQGQGTVIDDEASRYFPLTPCRLADTRDPPGASGGPAMAAGSTRSFPVVATACGVAATAQAVAVIVTTTGQTSDGHLRLFPAPGPVPDASVVNFTANRARAGNGIVALGQDGRVGVYCGMQAGQTHVILDVMGYFQ